MPDDARIEQTNPEVLSGEDEFPREPPAPLDPYTPVPHPPKGEEESRAWSAMQLSLIPIAVVVAIVLYVAVR